MGELLSDQFKSREAIGFSAGKQQEGSGHGGAEHDFNTVFASVDQVLKAQKLFDELNEHFNVPSSFIQVSDLCWQKIGGQLLLYQKDAPLHRSDHCL